jgi:hypothetical protein
MIPPFTACDTILSDKNLPIEFGSLAAFNRRVAGLYSLHLPIGNLQYYLNRALVLKHTEKPSRCQGFSALTRTEGAIGNRKMLAATGFGFN